MHTQKNRQQHTGGANHSAFPARWLDGLCRALPGAEFPMASLTLAKVTSTAPVDATAAFAKHLTVATTARTTRFCRTHGPPFRRSFPSPVDKAGNLQTRRSLEAPLVGTKPRAHGEQSALPLASRPRTLPRPPQAWLANMTTTKSPLQDEPRWATHTSFPNFGKVEYFHQCGLTPVRVGLSRCFARRRSPPARRDAGDEPKGLVSACGRPGAARDNPSPPRT